MPESIQDFIKSVTPLVRDTKEIEQKKAPVIPNAQVLDNTIRHIDKDLYYNFDVSNYDPLAVNFNDLRAARQTTGDIIGNDIAQAFETFGMSTVQSAAVIIGGVGAGIKAGIDAINPNKDTDFLNDWLRNPIMQSLNEMDMAFKDGTGAISAPVYFTEAELKDPMNLKSFFNGLSNGIGFLASAAVPMGLLGKVGNAVAIAGKGEGLVNVFGKLGKLAGVADVASSDISAAIKFVGKNKNLTEISTKLQAAVDLGVAEGGITQEMMNAYLHYQSTLQKVGTFAGLAYSRMGESALESYQSYDTAIKDLDSKRKQGVEGYANLTDDKIKEIAAEGANQVFGWNMALLPLEYFSMARIFNGKFGIGKKAWLGEMTAENTAIKLTRGQKIAANLGRIVGTAIPEAEEEGIQYGLQETAKDLANDKALGKYDDSRNGLSQALDFLGESFVNNVKGFGTSEGQLSMLLGAVLGGGSQMFGNIGRNKAFEARSKATADLYAQYQGLSPEFNNTEDAKKFEIKDGIKTYFKEYLDKLNKYTKLEEMKNTALERDDKVAYDRFNKMQQTFTTTNKILEGKFDEHIDFLKDLQADTKESIMQQFGLKEMPKDENGDEISTASLIHDEISKAKSIKQLYDHIHETSVFKKLSFEGRQNLFYNLAAAEIDNEAIRNIDKSIEDIKEKSKQYYSNILDATPDIDSNGDVIPNDLIEPSFKPEYEKLLKQKEDVKEEHKRLIQEYKEWESNPEQADFQFLKGLKQKGNTAEVNNFVKTFDNDTHFELNPIDNFEMGVQEHVGKKDKKSHWVKDETGQFAKVNDNGEFVDKDGKVVDAKSENKDYWKVLDKNNPVFPATETKIPITRERGKARYKIHPTDKSKLIRVREDGTMDESSTVSISNLVEHLRNTPEAAKDIIFTPSRRTYEKRLEQLQDEKSVFGQIISDLKEKLSALVGYGVRDKSSKEYKDLVKARKEQLDKIQSKEYLLEKEIEYFKSGLSREESIAKAVEDINNEIRDTWAMFHALEEQISPKEVTGKLIEQERLLKQAEEELKNAISKRTIQGVKGFLKLSDPRLQEKLNQLKEILKLYKNQYNDLLEQQQQLEKNINAFELLQEENTKVLKAQLGKELVGQSSDIHSAQEGLYNSASALEDMVQQQETLVESKEVLTRVQSIIKWFKDKIDRLEKFITNTEEVIKRNEQLIEDIKYNHPIFSDVDFRWISSSELEESRLEQPEVVAKLEKLLKDNVKLRERVKEANEKANKLKDNLENYTGNSKEISDTIIQSKINYLVNILNELKDRIRQNDNIKAVKILLDNQDIPDDADTIAKAKKLIGSGKEKSVDQHSSSTSGRHFENTPNAPDSIITDNVNEKRFFKWAEQFTGSFLNYRLKVVAYANDTDKQYWTDKEIEALTKEGYDSTRLVKVVVVKKDTDGTFKPIGLNNEFEENVDKQIFSNLHDEDYSNFHDMPTDVAKVKANHRAVIDRLIESSKDEDFLLTINSKSNGHLRTIPNDANGKKVKFQVNLRLGINNADDLDLQVVNEPDKVVGAKKQKLQSGIVFVEFNGNAIVLDRSKLSEVDTHLPLTIFELLKQLSNNFIQHGDDKLRDNEGKLIKVDNKNVSIASFLHKVIYYGEGKAKKEDAKNIFIKDNKLYYYNYETKATVAIDLNPKSLEKNREKIVNSINASYHHVEKSALGKGKENFIKIKYNDKGEFEVKDTGESYQSYLINSKAIYTNAREFKKDNIDDPQFSQVYLNFDNGGNSEQAEEDNAVIEVEEEEEENTNTREDELLAKYNIDKKEYIKFKKYLIANRGKSKSPSAMLQIIIDNNANKFAVDNQEGLDDLITTKTTFKELEDSLKEKETKKSTPKPNEVAPKESNEITVVNNSIDLNVLGEEPIIPTDNTTEETNDPFSLFIENEIENPINLEWEKKVLKKILKLNIKTVGKLINGIAQGRFSSKDLIEIYENAAKGTLVHEAFHKVFRMLLTNKERAELYADFRKNYEGQTIEVKAIDELTGKAYRNKVVVNSEISNIDIEEFLADKFSEYLINREEKGLLGKILSFIKDWVRAITDFIGFTQTTTYDKLFRDIANGKFLNAENGDILEGTANSLAIENEDKLSNEDTTDLMNDVTSRIVFQIFNSNKITLEDINDRSKKKLVIEELNKYYADAAKQLADRLKSLSGNNKIKAERQLSLILTDDKSNFKPKYREEHGRWLAKYGLNIGYDLDELIDAQETTLNNKDFAFDQNSVDISSKQSANKEIKLLLASIPAMRLEKGKPALIYKSTNQLFRKTVDTGELFNFILEVGAKGIKDINTLFDNLTEKAKDTHFELIIDKLKSSKYLDIDSQDVPSNIFYLQQKFTQSFYKTKNTFLINILSEDGKVKQIDATAQPITDRIKSEWNLNLNGNQDMLVQKTIDGQKYNIINKVRAKALFEATTNVNKKGDAVKDDIDYLEKFGIKFTNKEVIYNLAYSETIEGKELKKNIHDAVTYINKAIDNKEDYKANDVFTDEFVYNNTIKALIKAEIENSNRIYDLQHINPEGKTVYSITLNNYLSTVINAINNSKTKKELLEQLPQLDTYFAVNSQVLNNIVFDEKGNKKEDILQIIFEGLRQDKVGEQGTNFDKLTYPDRLAASFNNVLKGVYAFIRASSKSLEHGFKFGEFVEYNDNIDKTIKIFEGYLQDELALAQALEEGIGADIDFYQDKKGLGLFNDIIVDNNGESNDDIINGLISGKIKEVPNFKELVVAYLDKVKADYLKEFLDNNLIEDNGENQPYTNNFIDTNFLSSKRIAFKMNESGSSLISKSDLNDILDYFTINNLIGNYEQTKIFTGNIAFYKNIFKRNSMWVGTKKYSVNPENVAKFLLKHPRRDGKLPNNKINTIVLNDIKSFIDDTQKEFFIENFNKKLDAIGITDKGLIEEWLSPYLDITQADGQGYISMDEYREFKVRMGEWGDKAETAWQKVMKGIQLNKDEQYYFSPIKAQYAWQADESGLGVPEGYKFAIVPVLPTIGELMPNLGKLGKIMENSNNQVGIVLFESGNKFGKRIKNLSFKDLITNKFDESNIVITNYDGIGIQVDIADKIKNTTSKGTQQDKMMYMNIYNDGEIAPEFADLAPVMEERTDLNKKLYKLNYKNILNRLGLTRLNNRYEIEDVERLKELLGSEVFKRDLPTDVKYSIEALTRLTDKYDVTSLNTPLDVIKYQNEIESIINSVITKTVKYKKNGVSAVQAAEIELEAENKTNLKYVITEKNGKKSISMEVYLPNRFKGIFKEGQQLDSKFFGVSFRIPTQALGSIDNLIIKGFLPAEQGDTVFTPKGITSKTGSDYDVDKLTIYLPYTKIDDKGNTQYIEYYDTPNNAETEELFEEWYKTYLDTFGAKDANRRIEKLKAERKEKINRLNINKKISEGVRKNIISKKLGKTTEEYNAIYDRLSELITIEEDLREVIAIKSLQDSDGVFGKFLTSTLLNDIDIDKSIEELKADLVEVINEKEEYKKYTKEVQSLPEVQAKVRESAKRYQEIQDIIADNKERVDNVKEESRPIFIGLSIQEKNGKKRIENRLLEIEKEIIGHEANIGHLLTPNSDKMLSKLATEINTLYGISEKESTSVGEQLQWNFINKKASIYLDNKNLLGGAALQNSSLALTQVAGLYIKEDVHIPFEHNKNKEGFPSLAGRALRNGRGYISDLISTFITGFVDVENNPFIADLNVNDETVATYYYLTRLGVDEEIQALFMNQPILRDYVREINKLNSTFYTMKNGDMGITKIKEEAKKLVEAKYGKYSSKDKTIVNFYTIADKEKFRNNIKYSVANQNLDNAEKDHELLNFSNSQLDILNNFLNLQPQTEELEELVKATRLDTQVVGKSIAETDRIVHKIQKLKQNPFFGNINKLFDNTILGALEEIISDSVNIYSPLFLSQEEGSLAKEVINKILTPFRESKYFSDEKLNKLSKLVKQDFANFIVTAFNSQRNNTTSWSIQDLAQNLMIQSSSETVDNNTLAQELYNLQNKIGIYADSKFDAIRDNGVIKGLKPIINGNRQSVDGLKFENRLMTSEDVDKMIDDFMELSQISPNLATKIFQVSMLQTGLSQNPISLFSILPNAIYNKFLESSLTSYRANTTNFVESFYNSFYQNNWNTPSLVKYVKPNKFAIADMQAGKAAIMFSSDDFIKTKIGDEYLLMKKTFTKVIKGQEKNFYTVINKLGVTDYKNQHFFKEYGITEKPVSIIPDNNLKGINKIPVYQGTIEDKVENKKEAVKEVKENKTTLRKVNVKMQTDNIAKILKGTKTTTVRSETEAKEIGLKVGETGIVTFGNREFKITNKGLLTIEEAGGKGKVAKSENWENGKPKYSNVEKWAEGNGKLVVYDIKETSKKKYTKKENKPITDSDKKWGMVIWNKYKNRILAKHKEAKAFYYIQRVANKGYKDTVEFIEKCYKNK